MTEQATRARTTPPGETEWDIPAVPIDQAKDLFVVLGKALRAYQLYDENNPVYQRFVTSLRDSFKELWNETDELRVQVEEFRILWYDEVVYENTTRSESLAFLFFKDGVREIGFLPGIEEQELERLLRVLQRARNLRPEGEDLLTILWDEDLSAFEYRYVDLLAEGVELPERSAEVGDLQMAWTTEIGEEEADGDESAAARPEAGQPQPQEVHKPKVSTDDFNPTLYSLDPREVEQLQAELQREMERDVRRDVLAALFDRLEEPGAPARHTQILDIFRTLLPNLLGHGALNYASAILAELHSIPKREGLLGEEQKAEAGRILDEISASEAIEELVQAIREGSIAPTPRELGGLLQQLRAGALEPLLKASQDIEDRRIQIAVLDGVAHIGQADPDAIVGLFRAADPIVLAGACQLSGRMGLTQAGPHLGRLMDHKSKEVRLAAVQASVALKASTAAAGLQKALADEERDIRIAAAKGLTSLRYAPAGAAVKQRVLGKHLRNADTSERIAFFEAFGALGGDEAVRFLARILNRKGILGRREPDEIRACAALGLGRAGTPDAMAALRAAQNTSEPVVRSAIGRALRGDFES